MGENVFYQMVVILLIINKVFLSGVGAKVRQNLINPAYLSNQKKLKEIFDINTQDEDYQKVGVFELVGHDKLKNMKQN
jgi:hypothetical protein